MPPRNFGLITAQSELEDLIGKLAELDGPIGYDIETGYDGDARLGAALHPEDGFIVGFSISGDPRWARYVPVRHDFAANLDPDEALPAIMPLSGRLVAHNTKFERRFLRAFGIDPLFMSDTMVECYVLSLWESVGLKHLTKMVFGYEPADLISLFPGLKKKDAKSIRFNILDLTPEVVDYACDDAAGALGLHQKHYPLVKDNFIYKVEMGLQTLLCEMEESGVLFDWNLMLKWSDECVAFQDLLRKEIMADISAMTGKPFDINLGSPKQIGDVLFGELGMQTGYKTKTGANSTSAIALNSLSKKYPVVKKILQWKELRTLNTRYLSKWPLVYSYAPDGRTHPNIMQAAVGTGRFAVDGPPYQQAPKKYKYTLADGREFIINFRDAIYARPGYYLIGFDYSQVELRAIAGAAQEPMLLEAYRLNLDVHSQTASLMLGVARDLVTPDQRDVGKTMNFALMYQMGPGSLADRLAISRDRARELYDSYFANYSSIAMWVARAKEAGKIKGYAETHFGRKFKVWELLSSDPKVYAKGERVLVNAPIQGWAADYMKIAMNRERAAREKAGLLDGVHLIMNVHDALVYEVREDISPQSIISVVDPAVSFEVAGFPKIVTEWEIGKRWGSMVNIKLDDAGQIVQDESDKDDDPFAVLEDEEGEESAPSLNLDLDAFHGIAVDQRARQAQSTSSSAPSAAQAMEVLPAGGDEGHIGGQPQPFIVELSFMPNEDQVKKMVEILKSKPGANICRLRTPQGDVTFEFETGVDKDDTRFLLLFVSCKTYVDVSDVDPKQVLGGILL